MRFTESPIGGVVIVQVEPVEDARGAFTRTYCQRAFSAHGLAGTFVQCAVATNRRAGTLRGLHWQAPPHQEAKLVRVSRGALYDVALDLRPESPTWLRWFAVELSAANRRMLHIPSGVAHGYQTLRDDTEVAYQMSAPYTPSAARGVRWDDPAFAIRWPPPPPGGRIVCERDRTYPSFDHLRSGLDLVEEVRGSLLSLRFEDHGP